ncbi:hypothetical protein Vafri_3744 [Volvox africanus]|uniref:Uncharacterized protein n=1 Tax=Volvox africanus TaxID=51714 RepID=A0A8J4AS95_9CHLO|nr:hypothetical protein Vafri_3744 [Volvox africanus]
MYELVRAAGCRTASCLIGASVFPAPSLSLKLHHAQSSSLAVVYRLSACGLRVAPKLEAPHLEGAIELVSLDDNHLHVERVDPALLVATSVSRILTSESSPMLP